MDYLTTRGLVLRTTEYKETDRILTVLSADRGLLTMKARGVRSNRSKLKGACQLLTYAEFTVGEAHGFSSITEATAIEMFPELRMDIELLALASYFAQLAGAFRLLRVWKREPRPVFHCRRDARMRVLPRVRRGAHAVVACVSGCDAVYRLLSG